MQGDNLSESEDRRTMLTKESISRELLEHLIPKVKKESQEKKDDFALVTPQQEVEAGNDTTSLDDVLDSMAYIELLVFIERAFDIEFEDEELIMDVFENVGTLANAILQKASGSEGA